MNLALIGFDFRRPEVNSVYHSLIRFVVQSDKQQITLKRRLLHEIGESLREKKIHIDNLKDDLNAILGRIENRGNESEWNPGDQTNFYELTWDGSSCYCDVLLSAIFLSTNRYDKIFNSKGIGENLKILAGKMRNGEKQIDVEARNDISDAMGYFPGENGIRDIGDSIEYLEKLFEITNTDDLFKLHKVLYVTTDKGEFIFQKDTGVVLYYFPVDGVENLQELVTVSMKRILITILPDVFFIRNVDSKTASTPIEVNVEKEINFGDFGAYEIRSLLLNRGGHYTAYHKIGDKWYYNDGKGKGRTRKGPETEMIEEIPRGDKSKGTYIMMQKR